VKKVAVLYGGISTERAVSLTSGEQVIAALRQAGYDVVPVLVGEDMVGMKFGEFAPTRYFPGHAADKKAKRK